MAESVSSSPQATYANTGYVIRPLGVVRKQGEETVLVLLPDFAAALRGLEGFSHVWVLWWFDRNDTPEKRKSLQVHPRGDERNPLTGVFACRAPVRPNPIALTLCRVLAVRDNVVTVDGIEAFDGSPVVDLKPYIPGFDWRAATVPHWLADKAQPPAGGSRSH